MHRSAASRTPVVSVQCVQASTCGADDSASHVRTSTWESSWRRAQPAADAVPRIRHCPGTPGLDRAGTESEHPAARGIAPAAATLTRNSGRFAPTHPPNASPDPHRSSPTRRGLIAGNDATDSPSRLRTRVAVRKKGMANVDDVVSLRQRVFAARIRTRCARDGQFPSLQPACLLLRVGARQRVSRRPDDAQQRLTCESGVSEIETMASSTADVHR